MTRFVAALLIARGQVVTAQADPRAPGCEDLGDVQPSARLLRAFAEGRKRRADDDELMRGLAGATAPAPDVITRTAGQAWAAREQQ